LAEFTGERVIPGLVDDNLFNEHLARYRFASRFGRGAHVLDAGCGSGYGTAEFGTAASVTAADISADALQYARRSFGRPGVRFVRASCEALPFAPASFDLITAFEVIEHLEHWQKLLDEANRVLKPSGTLLVSTPNKSYYAEARGAAGPNPFHSHEFERAEFETALYAVFPHVRLWTQNHCEAIVFAPSHPGAAALDARGDATPDSAHFFVAACSHSPLADNDVYAWLPSSANLLREREHHIAMLEGERNQKDVWLQELTAAHASLHSSHEATLAELRQRNEWAAGLNREVAESRATIGQLQQEAADRLRWVRDLETQLAGAHEEILRLNRELAARTAWALGLDEQLGERNARIQSQREQIAGLTHERLQIVQSKWFRLGHKLHLGPVLHNATAGEE
jgi:ubiquinone/menaquinone biosynthesis C-methylase UbiE